MMYGSWDMECDRQKFFSFWTTFCPFTLLTTQKSKFWKNERNTWTFIILQKCTINDNHMMYGSWNMKCDRQNILSFWANFCPFTPITTQKIKILKKWKKHLEISSFYTGVLKNYDQMMYDSWDMVCNRWMDGQIDKWKRWHIEVGAPPKKI